MTTREIEQAKFDHWALNTSLRGLIKRGTPSRLGVYLNGRLCVDHSKDKPITRGKR